MPRWLKIFLTFHFVTLAWVFFRAADMETAWRIFSGPFIADWGGLAEIMSTNSFPLILIGAFLAFHGIDGHARVRWALARMPRSVIWSLMISLWVMAITISAGSSSAFIYFDF